MLESLPGCPTSSRYVQEVGFETSTASITQRKAKHLGRNETAKLRLVCSPGRDIAVTPVGRKMHLTSSPEVIHVTPVSEEKREKDQNNYSSGSPKREWVCRCGHARGGE